MLGTDLILTTALFQWYYFYAHFTKEKSEAERLSNLPKVIELEESVAIRFNPRKYGSRTSVLTNVL